MSYALTGSTPQKIAESILWSPENLGTCHALNSFYAEAIGLSTADTQYSSEVRSKTHQLIQWGSRLQPRLWKPAASARQGRCTYTMSAARDVEAAACSELVDTKRIPVTWLGPTLAIHGYGSAMRNILQPCMSTNPMFRTSSLLVLVCHKLNVVLTCST
jgi:hypothetical protein